VSSETTRPSRWDLGPQRLVLGTAQLVEPYGIVGAANSIPSEGDSRARDTLEAASLLQLAAVDTAPSYGRAEAAIGSSDWHGSVWTKLDTQASISGSVARSLEALQRTWIDVLFIHDMQHLRRLSVDDIIELQGLVGETIGALGISAYSPEDVVEAHELIGVSVVQAPVNVFDTRFESALVQDQLPGGLTFVARSALLQGALANPMDASQRLHGPLAEHLVSWTSTCASISAKPGEAALSWVLTREFVDLVIVGAEDARQLREVASWSQGERAPEILAAIEATDLWPHSDPRRW
jgi:aryl-alcohol dehydrogenase-like predicted oxidoreductase